MDQSEVFGNLKKAFEDAVESVLEHGLPKEYETRRSELLAAVLNEVSRRKNAGPYNGKPTANVLTGRKRYERY